MSEQIENVEIDFQTVFEESLANIATNIGKIQEIDFQIGGALADGFNLSMKIIQELQEGTHDETDMSKNIELINAVLGISLEDLVKHILEEVNKTNETSSKEADKETLDFITSNLDDYEKFLAKAKASDDLEFLSKSI